MTEQASSEAGLWLTSRRVVLGDSAATLRVAPARIKLRGSTIASVQPLDASSPDCASPDEAPPANLIDYGDKLIAPAFINAHTHLALGFLRGADISAAVRGNMVEAFFFAIERRMQPADVRAFARMGAYESLLAGVGLVWDHYYAAEELAAALVDVGLSGVVAPTLQDVAGPGTDSWEAQLAATETIDGDKALRSHGVYAALGPHATDTVSESLFGAALDMAERRRLPLHLHLAQSVEEYRRAQQRHGCTPTAWLQRIGVLDRAPATVLAHGIYASRDDLKRLADPRHTLVFCPYSQLIFGFPAPVDVWERQGLRWVVATDCASNNDTMNVQKELRLVAGQRTVGASWSAPYRAFLEQGGLDRAEQAWAERGRLFEAASALASPAALLERVWGGPGRLHPWVRAGVIAPGALANLAVFDGEHPSLWPCREPLSALAMADPAAALWSLWVAGRRIGEDGALHRSIVTSDAYRQARTEAEARLTALLD